MIPQLAGFLGLLLALQIAIGPGIVFPASTPPVSDTL
jgi:hypothetical protein